MEQPPLSELTQIFTNELPKPKFKALCENIFDVPRSGLLDVLETLQEAFWTDEPDPNIYRPSPTLAHTELTRNPPSSFDHTAQKIDSTTSHHPHKRQRLTEQASSSAVASYQQPTSPSPPPSPPHYITAPPVYATKKPIPLHSTGPTLKLWTVKWVLLKQLKASYPEYKEKQVLALWQSFQEQGTLTEIRHLASYLLPVACAMRRWTIAQSLQQVLPVG